LTDNDMMEISQSNASLIHVYIPLVFQMWSVCWQSSLNAVGIKCIFGWAVVDIMPANYKLCLKTIINLMAQTLNMCWKHC